jgi:hypothetical protein
LKWVDNRYNINYMIKKEFITLGEVEKIFYMFSNSIDC